MIASMGMIWRLILYVRVGTQKHQVFVCMETADRKNLSIQNLLNWWSEDQNILLQYKLKIISGEIVHAISIICAAVVSYL
jgi:hypothetical protein